MNITVTSNKETVTRLVPIVIKKKHGKKNFQEIDISLFMMHAIDIS